MTPLQLSLMRLGYSALKDAYRVAEKFISVPVRGDDDDLSRHLITTEAWSSTIHMFGMAKPLNTEDSTIQLAISSQPRKFYKQSNRDVSFTEQAMLETRHSVVILGDPGSGKTTIIKRLIREVMLTPVEESNNAFLFPILVFGREIRPGNGLFDDLFRKIGFTMEPPKIPPSNRGKFAKSLRKKSQEELDFEEYKDQKFRNGLIERAVSASLCNAAVLLMIDGVDEIDDSSRAKFQSDIENLNNVMTRGKVIMTCRSGDWSSAISNFEIFEVCALSDNEISKIVSLWADNPDKFVNSISGIPYRDILDRPLFLTMLIIVYNQTGSLPDRPVDVYQRATSWLLDKWDSQRQVKRLTKYDGFLTERKFKFLCSIAYILSVEMRLNRFDVNALRVAFNRLSRLFGLPAGDCEDVIREIESHTGIIVESGFGNFEFCHLTVQEFLAASHLVNLPSIDAAAGVFTSSPSIVAVAACLSSDTTEYASRALIACLRTPSPGLDQSLNSFIARFKLENPVLLPSTSFGVAMILLLHLYDEAAVGGSPVQQGYRAALEEFFTLCITLESISTACEQMIMLSHSNNFDKIRISFRDKTRLLEASSYEMKLEFSQFAIDFMNKYGIFDNFTSGGRFYR